MNQPIYDKETLEQMRTIEVENRLGVLEAQNKEQTAAIVTLNGELNKRANEGSDRLNKLEWGLAHLKAKYMDNGEVKPTLEVRPVFSFRDWFKKK